MGDKGKLSKNEHQKKKAAKTKPRRSSARKMAMGNAHRGLKRRCDSDSTRMAALEPTQTPHSLEMERKTKSAAPLKTSSAGRLAQSEAGPLGKSTAPKESAAGRSGRLRGLNFGKNARGRPECVFKAAGTKGIQSCEIRSVILPLLADHVLREANHYIRLLKE